MYHNVRGVKARYVQCDEIWSFCYAKEKNVPAELAGQFGYQGALDLTAMDSETKLLISYVVAALRDAVR